MIRLAFCPKEQHVDAIKVSVIDLSRDPYANSKRPALDSDPPWIRTAIGMMALLATGLASNMASALESWGTAGSERVRQDSKRVVAQYN
jgi:hypothetical protein